MLMAYLSSNPIIIRGQKVVMLPRYTKPKECDFPTTPVPVNTTKLMLHKGVQIVLDVQTKRTLNPFRIPFGEVGKSRHSPKELLLKDLAFHNLKRIGKHVIHTLAEHKMDYVGLEDKVPHSLLCIAPDH